MRKRLLSALLALCMVLILLPTAFAAGPDAGSPRELGLSNGGAFSISIEGTRAYAYAYQVADQVNRIRAGLGLSQLVIDPVLMETAMQRAAECAVYYSHTRPNGTRCFTVFPNRNWTYRAENIAAGYTTPAAVMDGWTDSPDHYENIVSTSVNAIGVGCFYANGIYYWAQSFTGGAYSSSSARLGDRTVTATFPVVKEHFSPVGGNTSAISLRVGESCRLPVYTSNLGFYNYTATVSGIDRASLSTGTGLVKLNGDTLTITAIAVGSGTVTLRLPSGDTLPFTVQVTKQSADVPDWCADAVNWALDEGIAKGYGNGRFGAADNCTNAQLITFLWRAEGEPAANAKAPFPTVAAAYRDAIDWAYERGIIDNTFIPGAYCTRATAVSCIWQVFGSRSAAKTSFSDVPAGADYAGAVTWAVANGITNGTGGNHFSPDKLCSRAEIVTFLHRAYVSGARLK